MMFLARNPPFIDFRDMFDDERLAIELTFASNGHRNGEFSPRTNLIFEEGTLI